MIQAGTSSQTQAMPLVLLSENDRLRLVIPVPESAVSRIRLGQHVEVTVQSLHKTVSGTVARFADRLDTDTRTMRVEVDVQNPSLELVPGMYADASLALEQVSNVIVAPVQAVDHGETGARVLAVGRDEAGVTSSDAQARDRRSHRGEKRLSKATWSWSAAGSADRARRLRRSSRLQRARGR